MLGAWSWGEVLETGFLVRIAAQNGVREDVAEVAIAEQRQRGSEVFCLRFSKTVFGFYPRV